MPCTGCGAVAIDLAAKHGREFAAAFIEASFTSMLDMSTVNPLYRLLPIGTLPAMVQAAGGAIWSPHYEDLIPALVKDAQARGLKVIP